MKRVRTHPVVQTAVSIAALSTAPCPLPKHSLASGLMSAGLLRPCAHASSFAASARYLAGSCSISVRRVGLRVGDLIRAGVQHACAWVSRPPQPGMEGAMPLQRLGWQ